MLGTARIARRRQDRRDKRPGVIIVWAEGSVQVSPYRYLLGITIIQYRRDRRPGVIIVWAQGSVQVSPYLKI